MSTERLVAGALAEDVELSGDLGALDAEGCRLVDCRLVGATAAGGHAPRSSWRGTRLEQVRFAGVGLARSTWLDVTIERSSLAGCELYGAQWRRVTVTDSVLDSLNLREARLRDVRFTDCVLRHLDLGSARLSDVVLSGCRVVRLTLPHAVLTRVDLRGSQLDVLDGVDALRGATIDLDQLVTLAPVMAAHLGLKVVAPGEPVDAFFARAKVPVPTPRSLEATMVATGTEAEVQPALAVVNIVYL